MRRKDNISWQHLSWMNARLFNLTFLLFLMKCNMLIPGRLRLLQATEAPLASILSNAFFWCNLFYFSTKLLASTTLRNILGTKNLSEILSDREHIARDILAHLDTATDAWGIKVKDLQALLNSSCCLVSLCWISNGWRWFESTWLPSSNSEVVGRA